MILMRGVVWLLLAACAAPLWAAELGRPAPVPAEPAAAGSLLQVLLALVLVVVLIIGMAWLMRRISGISYSSGGAIRILGGVQVGQRERVVLVQVGSQQLLLGVAPGRVQTLHVLDEPVSMHVTTSSGDSFAERLASALKKGGQS